MYVDLARKPAPPAAARAPSRAESVGDGLGSPRLAPSHLQIQDALNNSAPMRAQAELGNALNQRAAVVAQRSLAQTLSSRAAVQREEDSANDELIQRKPAAHIAQRREMPGDDSMQQKSAGGAVQREPLAVADVLAQRRDAALQRAAAPVQRVPYWLSQVPGLAGLAGAVGGGGYLGLKAGAALGSLVGPVGTAIGGAVGGLGGALLGGWSALRAKAAYEERTYPPLKGPLGIAEIIDKRASDLKKRDKGGKDAELQYLEPGLREKVRAAETAYDARKAIEEHYERQIATGGTYGEGTKYNGALTTALRGNPLIQQILSGELLNRRGPQSALGLGAEEMPIEQGNLEIPAKAPPRVKEAKAMFDALVARKLPPVSSIARGLTPESAMGHEGDLYLGWGSPRGAVLHEFGHHLEHNLLPHEIASLHNFLRARSKSGAFRRVGPERALGLPQGSTGYDIEAPTLNVGRRPTALGLVGNVARFLAGSRAGGEGIDRYVMASSDRPDVSYSTKVYGSSKMFFGTVGGLDTEYLSTTIHFFSDPQAADELVQKDPMRVALFLSLANPAQFSAVARAFYGETGVNLNRLIHRIGEDL